ncbi:MAG: ATP-dependent helicase [Deltaproteobacteria bacterium]|nr:ATP-dependent helicase [Deltaproteobacteria bacterium]
MVERLVAGLQKDGFKPPQLVAITFTEKAAQEIKDRVVACVGRLGSATLPQQAVDQLWVSTIHGFCRRILKEHAWEAGLSTTFSVLSSEQAFFLKNKVFQETFQKLLQAKDPAFSFLLTEYGFYKLKSLVKGLYEKRFQLRTVQKVPSSSARILDPLFSVFHKIESEYQTQKKQKNVCDFDDLLWNCFDLLKSHPALLKHYRKLFKLILVDEFQDTNDVQRLIIDLLTQEPQCPFLMVVGDPKQSIYRFRGADVSLFYEVKEDILEHQGFCFELLENFRSHKTLIEFTNTLFQPLLGEAFIASEPTRMEPRTTPSIEYWTRKEEEGEDLSSEGSLTQEARKKEAAWLSAHLKKQGKWGGANIAILFRAMTFSPLYEETKVERSQNWWRF